MGGGTRSALRRRPAPPLRLSSARWPARCWTPLVLHASPPWSTGSPPFSGPRAGARYDRFDTRRAVSTPRHWLRWARDSKSGGDEELGDASVPFTFDVHALFFSEDAVGVEAMLHREFAVQRLSKVNLRKEFFRVEPQAVLDELRQHNVSVLEFQTHAAAEDFRASWPS